MENSSRRLNKVLGHLAPVDAPSVARHNTAAALPPSDDDVVVVAAVRTAIGKAKRGGFKDTHWTDLLATVLKEVVVRAKLPSAELVEDVQVGTVLAPGGGATQARMAMYLAGFPDKVPVATLNRQCSSGLQAFATVAGQIKAGIIDIGIAAGVESMSNHDMMQAVGTLNDKVFAHDKAKNCLISMGQTSENVVEKYNISRDEQDKFALRSQQKAYKAQQAGNFKDEIVPVTTKVVAEDGSSKTITISEDEGIRGDTTLASLNKLRPAFKQGGSTTAGNSSQVSDGAAAVLLCSRRKAKELGLKPLLRFRSFAVVGVPPEIMGVGPAYAIPEAVKKAGVQLSDIDVFEINEAFASQAGWTIKKLGIPEEKVNPNGGAIALGHPLGCTGARQIATLLSHMKRNKLRFGSTSMCIGTGMGAASVFENEQ